MLSLSPRMGRGPDWCDAVSTESRMLTLAQQIRDDIKRRRLNASWVAKGADLPYTTVREFLAGTRELGSTRIDKLLNYLGLRVCPNEEAMDTGGVQLIDIFTRRHIMAVFDLKGPGGITHFGLQDWHFVVQLAEDYGWKPEGTVFDELPESPMMFGNCDDPEEYVLAEIEECFLRDYFSNHGQQVTDKDAEALAAALDIALDDIPNHDAINHKKRCNVLPRRVARMIQLMPGPRPVPTLHEAISAAEWFSGERKKRLVEFIAFCRSGGFEIHGANDLSALQRRQELGRRRIGSAATDRILRRQAALDLAQRITLSPCLTLCSPQPMQKRSVFDSSEKLSCICSLKVL